MTWLIRVVAIFLLGVSAAMADELVDFDSSESKVVLTSREYAGLVAGTAKRRMSGTGEGATGHEYLVFADQVRVAVINHQWTAKPTTWSDVDLVQYIATVNPDNPIEKKIGASAPYARGEASGRLVLFSIQEGTEGMACVAYDIKASQHRLTGFMCVPGTAPLTMEEAKRMVDGLGVKDGLAPL
jgi:hypothetical protein